MPINYTKNQLLDALTKSRELIKLGWIKNAWAKDQNNKNVEPWDESATCFCIEGAMLGATHHQDESHQLADACVRLFEIANPEFKPLLPRIAAQNTGSATKIGPSSAIPRINDHPATTHEQVIKMFDRAILLVKHSKFNKKVQDADS